MQRKHSVVPYFLRLLVMLIATLPFPPYAVAVTFEDMLSGFDKCQFEDVYVDIFSKKPVHAYFVERNLQPTDSNKDFAYFNVKENFYGLPVYKLMIPAGTFNIHAIFIDLSINRAREIVKGRFGTEYRPGERSDSGDQPALLTDPAHPNKSVLTCNPRE